MASKRKSIIQRIAENLGTMRTRMSRAWIMSQAPNVSDTRDIGRTDYVFYDKLFNGRAKGFEASGALAKPLASKKAGWVMGRMPDVRSVDDEYTAAAASEWLARAAPKILHAYEQSVRLGDFFITVNADLSVASISPMEITEIVDDNDFSNIIGWRIEQVFKGANFGNHFQTMTIRNEYYENRRIYIKYNQGTESQRRVYRNLAGRIPVVHIANNLGANERFGHSEAEPILTPLSWYNDILRAGYQGNLVQGRPMVVFQKMGEPKDVEEFMQAFGTRRTRQNDEGKTETYYTIDVDTQGGAFLLTGDGEFKFESPDPFIGETSALLQLFFYLILQYSEIPEFVWGNAIQSSKASSESQMPAFIRWIEKSQLQCQHWLMHAIRVALGYMAISDPRINPDANLYIQWEPLTADDGRLTLDAIDMAIERELITKDEARDLLPLQLANRMPVSQAFDPDVDGESESSGESIQEAPQKYSHISFSPPNGVRTAARRALQWIKDGKAGSGFTATGRKRASDLARAGYKPSPEIVRRMNSYFSRHTVDKDAEGFNRGEKGYPSAGRVAWDAWGGDPGASWSRKVVRQMKAADEESGESIQYPIADWELGLAEYDENDDNVPFSEITHWNE